MAAAAFTVAAALYAAASALFLAFLAGAPARAADWATRVAAFATVVHLAYEALVYTEPAGIANAHGIHQTLSTLCLAAMFGFLWVQRRGAVKVVGAFVVPVVLVLFFGARFLHGGVAVPADVRGALLAVHITANLLGDAALTVAFAAAVAYLLQERALKRKNVEGIFRRLPPLDLLEAICFRFVAIAVPLLTVGFVTGAIRAMRHPQDTLLTPGQLVGIVTWALFGSLLLLRILGGWRGRRAALGTVVGYVGAVLVLVSYLLQPAGGG